MEGMVIATQLDERRWMVLAGTSLLKICYNNKRVVLEH